MLTIAEAAAITHRSPDMIRRYIREERITTAVRTTSGQYLIPPDALDVLRTGRRCNHRRPELIPA